MDAKHVIFSAKVVLRSLKEIALPVLMINFYTKTSVCRDVRRNSTVKSGPKHVNNVTQAALIAPEIFPRIVYPARP